MGQEASTVLASLADPLEQPRDAGSNVVQAPPETIDALIRKGKFAAAVDLAQRTVDKNKRRLGLEHPLTLRRTFELGKALHGDGLVGRALQVFQELLPLNEKVYGSTHEYAITTLHSICEELCNLGKYEQSLIHLNDARQRCEQACGLESERTVRLLVDMANMSKLLGKVDEAASVFSLALNRSKRGLGDAHYVTLGIQKDLREMRGPAAPDLERMKTLLRQKRLPVVDEPFPAAFSTTWREAFHDREISVISSVGYEASNAMSLRIGPINGAEKPEAPIFMPSSHGDPTKIELEDAPAEGSTDNSFESLIERSIKILPRGGTSATREAVSKHTAFLKGLKSLDELLANKEAPFWFFQRRESFMQQTTFQKWDANWLGRYVLIPIEGGFANPEDCIFVSHYWQTPSHPDPEGRDLRQLQELLRDGFWSKSAFFWVDWTCLPQRSATAPRTPEQQQYFRQALASISRLVRDCSFLAHFTEFRPRLWVLFEVAAFTFNRAEPVGLPCTDFFKKHLLQMKGNDVRLVLDKYNYACTNNADRNWVITQLEILLALRKTVPSIHTRRQILNAIDTSTIRYCAHEEVRVQVDKERGTLIAGESTYQFNPLPVEDSASELNIVGDHAARWQRALQRANQSFDHTGIGEIAREYDRAGDHDIAEALYRLALDRGDDPSNVRDLISNLENQEQYEEAAKICRQLTERPGTREQLMELHPQLVRLQQKDKLHKTYRKWKLEPLENILPITSAQYFFTSTRVAQQPALRNGLKRSWLQLLDQSVWQSQDPMVMKSIEEQALRLEEQGGYAEAQMVYLRLLERRKEFLGPYHIDTRRNLCDLARISHLAGNMEVAHSAYFVAHAVCDFTLSPWHPESRAVLGHLAETVFAMGKPGLARSYFRQHLERTLAVSGWDDPAAFPSKLFLHALLQRAELKIVQGEEGATVDINVFDPQDAARLNANSALAMAAGATLATSPGERSREEMPRRRSTSEKPILMLDLEKADFLFHKYTIARTG
ncbi:hypothetical protein B0I35DRAFT_485120 [Stachybotrys elegans]|uniref:Heterokaryon incompatibility domain-containing protein n=1 Tax=Stachybotrys elegans TaxID=80388 RepID=A0A8K0WK17_9HYPO|nr:hypothetical protein B0I35DRAFT_485120 [Stachybotrys elegans]